MAGKLGQTLLALFLAPLGAAMAEMIVGWTYYHFHGEDFDADQLSLVFFTLASLALAVSLFFVWPFHILARWRRWRSGLFYAAYGIVLGLALTGALYAFAVGGPARDYILTHDLIGRFMGGVAWIGGSAAATTILFWFIRRPDKDEDDPRQVFE